jgi:predicted hydrocarbon binding protein
MARRTALLHYFFSQTIIHELGEEKGRELIMRAIEAYGAYIGHAVREGVKTMGLPLECENFNKVPDLPKFGWETGEVTLANGEHRPVVYVCPLAETFKSLGPEAEELGRLYCYVDQAKYKAFNPSIELVHSRNMLAGDRCCEFWVRPADNQS